MFRSLYQRKSMWFNHRIRQQCAMALPDDGLVSAVHLDADKAIYGAYSWNAPFKTKIAIHERDPQTGELRRKCDFNPRMIVSSLCVDDDRMFVGAGFLIPESRGHIRLYNISQWRSSRSNLREPVATLTGHRNGVRALSFCSSGVNQGLLASCSEDATVRLWDLRDGSNSSNGGSRALYTFEPSSASSMGQIVAMSVEWDQNLIVAGSWSKSITCFDLRVRCPIAHVHQAHDRAILSVATSPLGRILSSSDDGTLREFDLRYCKSCPTEQSPAVAVVRIADYFPTSKIIKAIHLDTEKLITCHLAPPCSVVIWDSLTLEPRRIIPNSPVKSFSPIEPSALPSSGDSDLGSPMSMAKSCTPGDDAFIVGYQNRSLSTKLSSSSISVYTRGIPLPFTSVDR